MREKEVVGTGSFSLYWQVCLPNGGSCEEFVAEPSSRWGCVVTMGDSFIYHHFLWRKDLPK